MGINKRQLAGCLGSLSVLVVFLAIGAVVWAFRRPLAALFFDDPDLGSVLGLMVMIVIPFLGYVGYLVFKRT